jgi:hypothetical protein
MSYSDDQIWELALRAGEPSALNLHTTYGLRARNMRLFPRFNEGEKSLIDPDEFASPPAVHRFYPNYLLLTFSPFPGIDVVDELWVPEHFAIAGRFRIINNGVTPRRIRFDLISLLIPDGDGLRMSPTKMQGVTVLQGQTSSLSPVVFLTGGPQAISSPYPALSHEVELLPGLERQFTWGMASLPTPSESFPQAREIASRNWEGEVARIELTNASLIEITTGNPDWNAAFALGQKVALGAIHGPSPHLPYPSFVINRLPDQGYSLQGDGSDYNYLWNGQPPLEAWQLAQTILPIEPELAKGFLMNFLAVQATDGYVDWKPGLAGQRTRIDATPLLATLAWEIYETTLDRDFLAKTFPELLTFVLGWFGPYHDRDGDGIPEWDHPTQAGVENHPTFSPWIPTSQGVDIKTFESPSLCAFLIQECQSLIKIAQVLDRPEPMMPLQAHIDRLHLALDAVWDKRVSTYRYWDRDTHQTLAGKLISDAKGPYNKRFRRKFTPAMRLLIKIRGALEASRKPEIKIHGSDPQGEKVSEVITSDKLRWHQGETTYTSIHLFSKLSQVEVTGLLAADEIQLSTVDYRDEDLTLLLPLWARVPRQTQVGLMVRKSITDSNRYGCPFGLPLSPNPQKGTEVDPDRVVLLPWNALIIEGLISYGHLEQAADLVSHLMDAIIGTLKRDGAFRAQYHADTGHGLGERNTIGGLPPIRQFLDSLGVQLISPWKVGLKGLNPYPWPVEVKYKSLIIQRDINETKITFPNGEMVTVDDPQPCFVEG